jgi:Bifunctional DNA primase/polymerase, N-terminal
MSPVETRIAVLHNGYVPIPATGKACRINGWNTKTATNAEEIALQARLYPDHTNTGMLTRTTPAIDIDITILPAAEAVEQIVREEVEEHGQVMVRIGQAPKRAIPLRTDEPFTKIKEIFAAPDGSEHKVEILCDGQQVIVAGIHPDTGKPYSWHGGSPLTVRREELPYIRREDAVAILAKVSKLLIEEFGFQIVGSKTKGNGAAADDGPHERADWATLVGNIHAGRDLHDSTVSLAASYAASGGIGEREAAGMIKAIYRASNAPHDERCGPFR